MPISVVFDPPLPSDSPSTFNTKAFTLLGDLNDWSTQANALPGEVATNLTALLAAPPAIGGTTPAAGSFTTLNTSGMNRATTLSVVNSFDPINQFCNITIDSDATVINSNYASSGSGDISLKCAGAERARVSSSGLAVTGTLSVTKSGAGYQPAMLSFATPTETSAVYRIGMGGGNLIIGRTDTSTTNVTLDQSGNLGIGVTPSAWWTGYKAIDIGYGSISDYPNSGGTQIAANAFHSSNDVWNYKNSYFASMYQQGDGKHSWYTATSGTAGNPISFTQAMTLDASGNLSIGTTSAPNNVTDGGFGFNPQAAGNSFFAIGHKTGTASGDLYQGYYYNGSSIGSITQSGTTQVNFNGNSVPPSDRRLKTNIVDAPDASLLIDSIRIRSFDWIGDGHHQTFGVIAQELQEVAPEIVPSHDDPEEMLGVDYAKMVPMLIKEIQSLRARVAQLEG